MKTIVYYLSLPVLYGISYLPSRVLYFISDVFVFPMLYYVLKYRRNVVKDNLERSLPKEDHQKIEKEFYHFLADMFVETLKSFTISEKELQKRYSYANLDLIDQFADQNILITLGHYGNYEWGALYFISKLKHLALVPFRKFTNQKFQKLFTESRSRFGGKFFVTQETKLALKETYDKPYIVCLANDQSAPAHASIWTTFLNQETSFFRGTEELAKKHNLPVIFGEIIYVKRGHYDIRLQVITDSPQKTQAGEITKEHARLLENQIKENPAYWLWSHKRWKHKRPQDIPLV